MSNIPVNYSLNGRKIPDNGALVLCVISLLSVLLPLAGNAQTSATIVKSQSLTITSQRPLLDALQALGRSTTVPVSFEDIPYENSTDLLTVELGASGVSRVALKGGTLEASITVGDTLQLATQNVLAGYYAAGLPGIFQVVQRGDGIDVLPLAFKGADGSEKKLTPIMAQLVSFPRQERSVTATFQVLIDALSKTSGKRILLGDVPFPDDVSITVGAVNESASGVVSDISSALRPISFLLLYEPYEKAYYLTLTLTPFPPAGQQLKPGTPAGRVNPFFVKVPPQP